MTDHPITPPPELVQQWIAEIWHDGTPVQVAQSDLHLAARSAQWGADQELEACCEEMNEWGGIHNSFGGELADDLRAARRPKPPTQAEQALMALAHILNNSSTDLGAETIRRALEALPDD